MSATTSLDMEKCSVCAKMSAPMFIAERSWGRRVCHSCKERRDRYREEKRARHGSWKSLLGWLLPGLVLGVLSLWHFRAQMPIVDKTFTAIIKWFAKETDEPSGGGAGRAGRAAPVPAQQTAPAPAFEAPTLTLNLRSDALFDFGSASLKSAAAPALRDAAIAIRNHPQSTVVIRGYTDGIGSARANQTLSLQRAESVRNWMVKSGLPAKRISVLGLGARDPVAPNTKPDGSDNPAGRELNRRVTISITGG